MNEEIKNSLLNEALSYFDIKHSSTSFIGQNENLTYKITDNQSRCYLLRIHKSRNDLMFDVLRKNISISTNDMLRSELEYLSEIRKNTDIKVQKPIRNREGDILTFLHDGTPVTLLSWINGNTLFDMDKKNIPMEKFFKLGETVAKLHQHSIKWTGSLAYKRFVYDKSLIISILPNIKSAFKSGKISRQQLNIVEKSIERILCQFAELDQMENTKGIIHCDFTQKNLIVTEDDIMPIDFSLSGYSYYYMDLGSLFGNIEHQDVQNAIRKGYESITKECVDIRYIEPFYVLQAILFIAIYAGSVENVHDFQEMIDNDFERSAIPFIEKKQFLF